MILHYSILYLWAFTCLVLLGLAYMAGYIFRLIEVTTSPSLCLTYLSFGTIIHAQSMFQIDIFPLCYAAFLRNTLLLFPAPLPKHHSLHWPYVFFCVPRSHLYSFSKQFYPILWTKWMHFFSNPLPSMNSTYTKLQNYLTGINFIPQH